MLILGGAGHLYGAFIGAAVFMIVRDQLAAANPEYWFFWLGLMLVLVVLFARGGIIGGIATIAARFRKGGTR
jgi:branched-chain amino acid transport system permease protein